ncbi:hypothetical protein SHKM778_89360 [Streptomyces sp. KM77-8]|uniref:Uncharacterized protein n=1 Tax=Streptomyces haneummycinicus TaxID=3074435 RepID=A0AAT9HXW3_9ACTN
MVADVDGGAVLAQRQRLLLGPQVTDHRVRLDAEVGEVQLGVGLVLGGDDDRAPAGLAYRGYRLAGAREGGVGVMAYAG